jgi:hypothetical protein
MESVTRHIEEIINTLFEFTVPTSPGRNQAFAFSEAESRIDDFNAYVQGPSDVSYIQ